MSEEGSQSPKDIKRKRVASKKAKRKYEPPQLTELGELARGAGQNCELGSTADDECIFGGVAEGGGCTEGAMAPPPPP